MRVVLGWWLAVVFVVSCAKSAPPRTPAASFPKVCTGEGGTFPSLGLSAVVTFETAKSVPETNAPFTLKFYCTQGGTAEQGPFVDPGFPLNGETVTIWMHHTDGGHPGRGTLTLIKSADNTFRADNVIFSMDGDWLVRVVLAIDGSIAGRAEFKQHVEWE